MKYVLWTFFASTMSIANADEWFCKSQTADRTGNVISVCGVGMGSHDIPQQGRWEAYHDAQRNFESICDQSSDCHGHRIVVRPKRTDCELIDRVIDRCYQLIEVTILN